MRIRAISMYFILFICLISLCVVSVAVETDYFDWKGLKSYAAKNYSESIGFFDAAIKQDPNYIDAWLHKGDAQRAQKDYNASIETYKGALSIKNDTKAAWSGMIEDYISINNYPEASKAAARLTEIESGRKENWLREGDLLQMQGSYEEAIVKYEGALKLDAKYIDALYRNGISLMAMGNNSGATALFGQVLAIDPKYSRAYNAWGLILERVGKYGDAKAAYEKAAELDPKWSQPKINDVHSLLLLNTTNDAMKIFVTI